MSPEILGFLVFGLVIWGSVLSFFIWRTNTYLKKLFPSRDGNFKDRLVEVLERVNGLEEWKEDSKTKVSRVQLLRYNPFKDTGGDQSFSLALLDSGGSGVVITSLHSRAGTRVFAKEIKEGKESGTELSEEEREVVKEALK